MDRIQQRICHSRDRWSEVKEKEREKEGEEMTFCLYECLKAVGLQRHYARFTSMGVCRAAHLSALTMDDYPKLGICTMDDRTRLFHLAQMVKSDIERFVNEEEDDDYADEGYSVLDSSFTFEAYGDPDENIYNDDDDDDDDNAAIDKLNASPFARASCICRQLDFNCETIDHQLCGSKGKNNCRTHVYSHPSDDHTRGNTSQDFIGGISMPNSHTRLSPKCFSFHKSKPRPTTVTSKKFNNKLVGHKDTKDICRKEKLFKERGCNGASGHMAKSTPVYESKKTAGYNYGLPRSSPHSLNKRRAGDQRISVCVRKRPLTHTESRRGEADVVTTPGGECVIVHESKEAVDRTQYILQHRFYFDQVFGEESSNEAVYLRTAYPLVQHMLSGGKATCFAYGQTGAGKTHTMLGSSPGRPGLYALAVQDIFAHLSATNTHSPLLVYVSFFEIYCGQLYDLLDHRKRLFAREDGQKVVHIAGLHDVRVDSVSSLLEVISQGTEERTQGMSGMNPLSSRSHALLQIQLRSSNQEIAGRIWFVDLAGSERASDAKEPDRQSRMEGAEINQSLLALKECIRSLDQEQSHTPFRQSKLTQVLKDSFVGDSMTCMIANISPGHLATEHILNTLRYADRVKELRRQGRQRGGRRSKTSPSSKHNLSNSNSSIGGSVGNRGTSPPKKAKLGRQRESSGPTTPTTRLPLGDAVLCSTPKNSRWGEEPSARGRKGVGLEHVTPVKGWLGTDDKREKRERADERKDRRRENESCGRTENQSVSYRNARTGLVMGHPTDGQLHLKEVQEGERSQESNVSFSPKEFVLYHRENENQQNTFKGGREEERGWIEQQRQVEGSRDSYSEVGRQNKRDLENTYEREKEKERHLRWYHQQLQQFIPSTSSSSVHLPSPIQCPSLSSSNHASLSPSLSSFCSSLQHSSHFSVSALMHHDLEKVLDMYRANFQVRCDDNRGQLPSPSGEICLHHETSSSYNDSNDEDACGDCGLLCKGTEAIFGQGRVESEKKRSEKATGKVRVRKEEKRPAGIEGGERRWAWLATTEAEHAERITGAMPHNVEGQMSYSCDSEDRNELDKEGLDASDAPTDGMWSTENRGGADSSGLVSIHSNNDSNSPFNHPLFESSHQQAPAERPFSPTCVHTNTRLTPNKFSDLSYESKHTGYTSNILPIPLQNIPQTVPSSSHTKKAQCLGSYAIRRPFSNDQSATQHCTTSIKQVGCKIPAEPLNNQPKNPSYTQVHSHPEVKNKMPVLSQDETYADSLSYITDPLSISLLQVDQQVATASFLQGGQSNTSVCPLENEMGEDTRRKVEEDDLTCAEMVGNIVEDEDAELRLSLLALPQAKNVAAINNTKQTKDMCFATNEHYGIAQKKCPIPEVMLVSLKDEDNTQKPQTVPAIEVLSNKAPAPYLSTNACMQTSVTQTITPTVQHSGNIGSSSSHSLIPNGTTQKPPQCGQNMHRKASSFILTRLSESVLDHLNTVPTERNDQESINNQQIKHIMHLSTLEDMDHAQQCVVQAHWEQLEEMEALCHKEGVLLCQQRDMAFAEYVHKLEKIMERKAQCVHIMRAQLQPYLKPRHSNQSHNQGEDGIMMYMN